MTVLVRGLLLLLLLAPLPAASQVQIASWPVNSDFPDRLGQAQGGHVALTENDFRQARLYTDTGTLLSAYGPIDGASRMVEATDGSRFIICPYCPYLLRIGGSFLTFPSSVSLEHMVPLDNGRVLVALRFDDGTVQFRTYDGSLGLVGTFSGITGTSRTNLWMTRRPDGSVVACIYAPLLGRHLTAYTTDGTVLWDRTIADAGPVASDAEGNLYVRVSPTEIRVYDAQGNFHHQWFGPPGQPLNASDIVSSRDGTKLFVLSGVMKVFSQLPTPAAPTSWGRIKAIYR